MIAADDDTEKSMMDMARAERAELAAFLTTLTLQQWETPSLCAGWSVKEVVAHMISYEDLGVFGLLKRFAKGRIVRANEVGVDEFAGLSPQELADYVGRHLQPRGLTAGFGGMIALVDGMIHHQDIRRPLGQPRTIPAQRLDRVLRLMPKNPRLRARPRIKGLRLRATLAEVVLHVDDDQRPHTSTIRSGDCPGSLPTDAAATDIGSMTPRRSRT